MLKRTFVIKSFGCKVNQYEEQQLREDLIRSGLREDTSECPDYFILNSCTVTNQADKKAVRLIKSVKRRNPATRTIFTGCLAVLSEDIDRLKILPEIDMIVPNNEKRMIPLLLLGEENVLPVSDFTGGIFGFASHTRAFVKIQDGCAQECSYCKVTIVRGEPRSRETGSILTEIEILLKNGYKEIVLTGICIGMWRGSKGEKLSDLLAKIMTIDKKFRIRISSIEPNHIDEDLTTLIRSTDKICRHLHIPLQSGCDKTLKAMNRRYSASYFREIIEKVRSKIGLIGISLDVIAGFPDESDKDFSDSLEFIKALRPSRLHVFSYSDRKGTKAFDLKNKIPGKIIKERVNTMIIQGINMQKDFHVGLIGRKLEILIEEKNENGQMEGYSSEYARLRFPPNEAAISGLACFTPRNFDMENICLY